MKRILLLFGFFLTLFARHPSLSEADSLLDLLEKHDKIMGSFGIFRAEKPLLTRTIGYASVEDNFLANENTRYRIGSVSKMFTAVIILQLIQEKKLSLQTSLNEFFPGIPGAKEITIEHLLRHRSGIFNFTADPSYLKYHTKKMSRKKLVKKISSYNPLFKAGTMMQYSNSNYVLLTFIAEKIERKKFGKILGERIFLPCKMQDTRYAEKIKPKKNAARSYVKLERWIKSQETHPSVPRGAGAISSTVLDLHKFITSLFSGKLLSQKTLEEMLKMQDGYGLGIAEFTFQGKKFYGHNGKIDEFYSSLVYNPEDKTTLVYLVNGKGYSPTQTAMGLLKIYYGLPYKLPDFSVYETPDSLLEQYVGVYVSDNFPLKITIRKKGKKLVAQATGQAEFPLEAYDKHKFRFEAAGIEMEFFPQKEEMQFQQGKIRRTFRKEQTDKK